MLNFEYFQIISKNVIKSLLVLAKVLLFYLLGVGTLKISNIMQQNVKCYKVKELDLLQTFMCFLELC